MTMAYDEVLAARIRSLLVERGDVTERKMFGGIAYMVADHMAVGVIRDDLMVRVGSDAEAAALAEPHARPMDMWSATMYAMPPNIFRSVTSPRLARSDRIRAARTSS
jgi:TfoX/Sxy family transcriptional regulator of competence genes